MNRKIRVNEAGDPFPYKPLMFWEDLTYILQLIGGFFKKLLGLAE